MQSEKQNGKWRANFFSSSDEDRISPSGRGTGNICSMDGQCLDLQFVNW